MCEFALYRFADGSLAVGRASMIKNYDPVVHNSSTWPLYEDSSQTTGFVIVSWPPGSGRIYRAHVVEFAEDRRYLDEFCDTFIEELERAASMRNPQRGTTKRRKVNSTEDEVLLQLRQQIKEEQVAKEGSEDLLPPATAAVAVPSTELIAQVESLKLQLATAEKAREAAEKRASVAEERERVVEEKLAFLCNELWPKLEEIPALVDALQALTSRQDRPMQQERGPSGHSFGSVVVPAVRLVRLNGKLPSVYTQELAEMIFGRETLATSCLNGTVGGKKALCKASVDDIVDYVVQKFPTETTASVRNYLRRKCNNVSTASKK